MKNQALLKILALSLISAFSTYFLGNFLAHLCTEPGLIITTFVNISAIVTLLLTLAASGAFLSLAPSFNPKNQEIILAAVIPTLGFLTPQLLLQGKNLPIISATAFLFFVAIVKFGFAVKNAVQNRIKINVWDIYPAKIKGFLLTLSFVISLSFGASYFLKIEREGFKIPSVLIDKIMDLMVPITEEQLERQLESQLGEKFAGRLGIKEQEELLKFLNKELGETLREGEGRQMLGLTPENLNLEKIEITEGGKLDLSEAFSGMKPKLESQIEKMLAPFQKFIAPLLAISLFSTLYLLSRVAVLLCPLLIALILKIFSLTGFTRIEKEMVEVERFKL